MSSIRRRRSTPGPRATTARAAWCSSPATSPRAPSARSSPRSSRPRRRAGARSSSNSNSCRPERKRRTSSPPATGMRSFAALRMTGIPRCGLSFRALLLSATPKDGGVSVRAATTAREENDMPGQTLFDKIWDRQVIVHVMGPEQGVSLPGTLLVCGDSHTCTHGGMGAIAFGIGATEVIHVLAMQSLVQRKPKRMRVTFDGKRAPGVTPKDMILHLIGQIGAAGGTGYAVEYAGSAIRDMEVEGRLTVCNLSIELGAKIGMVAPDDVTFKFLEGRPYA